MRDFITLTMLLAAWCSAADTGADENGFLDFEEPEVFPYDGAPNPYFGTTWSTRQTGGSHLALMNIEWYNDAFGSIGANLIPRSGNQVGFNSVGVDNVSASFAGDMFIDFYLTPHAGDDFSRGMQVDFYNDDVLVHSFMDIPMILNEWTHIDGRSIAADKIVLRNFNTEKNPIVWFMDDLTFTKVPAPGALALLGFAALGRHRRSPPHCALSTQ